MRDTSDRGLGSPNMSEDEKYRIQSAGGTASPQNFANNPGLARRAGKKRGQKGGRSRARGGRNRDTGSHEDNE